MLISRIILNITYRRMFYGENIQFTVVTT
jgi:hypothetical protein